VVQVKAPEITENIGGKIYFIYTPPNITSSQLKPKRTFKNTLPDKESLKIKIPKSHLEIKKYFPNKEMDKERLIKYNSLQSKKRINKRRLER